MSLGSTSHCKIGGPRGSLAPMDDLGLDLDEDRAALEQASPPDYIHLDIIDGSSQRPNVSRSMISRSRKQTVHSVVSIKQFFSLVTSGREMVQSLREKLPNAFLDVHMMVKDPENWVDEIASAGADQFTFHIEATDDPSGLISHIRNKGMKVGIALKPTTQVEAVLPHVSRVDMVLVMTAEPGVEGQDGVVNPEHKVETLQQKYPNLLIRTDGWEQLPKEQISVSSDPQESESDLRSWIVVEQEIATTNTTTSNSCVPQTSSTTIPAKAANGQHSHSRSYGALATNGSQCSCDTSCDDAAVSESQPLLASQSTSVSDPYDRGGSSYLVVPPELEQQSPAESIRCECHTKVIDKTAKRAKIKLVLASIIALGFMAGEVVGGYFAGSLAIMTDAAHMLSDFAGFLISLFAIWLGSRPSSNRMSFGWHRAEVVGAVVSVAIIWVITGILVYEAVLRVIHPERFEVNADIMLITASIGVYVNVFMCGVLHPHSHGHGHGHKDQDIIKPAEIVSINITSNDFSGASKSSQKRKFWQRKNQQHNKHGSEENINVRAAFIHVIGDLIQSIGVVIAGYIIWFKPEWKIADPICTFIFCILVLISTLSVLKDALRVLMEATPKHVNYQEVKKDLSSIPGVRTAHSLHIWSLTLNKTALAAHLVLEANDNHQDVLREASKMLRRKHNITSTTLQVENHDHKMEDCSACQERNSSRFCCPALFS